MPAQNRDAFFESMDKQGLALTFEDVTIATRRSAIPGPDVDTRSMFSEHVGLEFPVVSAAMDTVTTATMATAMARLGGIGVIHAGLSPKEQGKEVRRVKHALNGRIEDPITVQEDDTLGQVLERHQKYDFTTYPVTTKEGTLVGMFTDADRIFELGDRDVLIGDIMTPRSGLVVADPDTDYRTAFTTMKDAGKKKTLPLVDDEGRLTAMYVLSDIERLMLGNPDDYNLDDRSRLRVAAAVPTNKTTLERIQEMDGYVDAVVIDTSQGDSRFVFETLQEIKNAYPELDVVAGNITDGASAVDLAKSGANGIKVGQGPGSICTTRDELGIGTPQLTAVYECARALRDEGLGHIPVCADGGIAKRGHIIKALAAGASSVMMGRRLAGTDEAPGFVITVNGITMKDFYGMGSERALRTNASARERYAAQGIDPLPEGVESRVPYEGAVSNIIERDKQGVRRSMSMQGMRDIPQLQAEAKFRRMTDAGKRESTTHDVEVLAVQ